MPLKIRNRKGLITKKIGDKDMKTIYKILMLAIMVVVTFSCACKREVDDESPIKYELKNRVTFYSPDSTAKFTLLEGCVIYVNREDDPTIYELINSDMIDDKETYRDVLVRMGMLNDSTEVKGYMNVHDIVKHKRLRR